MRTKIILWIPAMMLIITSIFLVTNCTKEDEVTNDATIPILTTNEVTEVTPTTAKSGGSISSDGGATITERGVCWSTTQLPTIADNKAIDTTGAESFTSSITDLTANTTYYVRAYAINSVGIGYGSTMSFTTLEGNNATIPVLTTNEVTEITLTTAKSGASISSDGGASITERGVCWSTTQTPTIADYKTTDDAETEGFTCSLTGLRANTTYYVRAYATNSEGTGYGSTLSFTTLEQFNPDVTYGSITDIDGNTYKTVLIYRQTWMAENLKVTKYNDGTSIPNVTNKSDWRMLVTGAFCSYDNTSLNSEMYGKLYNWFAVNTGKLCPIGWHVPSFTEWNALEDTLIMLHYNYDGTTAGNKIAQALACANGWKSSSRIGVIGNTDYPNSLNETGFAALPGGYCFLEGVFNNIGDYGYWWSSTEYSTVYAQSWYLYYDNYSPHISTPNKASGLSVRCVKD